MFAGSPDSVYTQIKKFYDDVGGFGHLTMIGRTGFLTGRTLTDRGPASEPHRGQGASHRVSHESRGQPVDRLSGISKRCDRFRTSTTNDPAGASLGKKLLTSGIRALGVLATVEIAERVVFGGRSWAAKRGRRCTPSASPRLCTPASRRTLFYNDLSSETSRTPARRRSARSSERPSPKLYGFDFD
jgi:hypothetical protein